MPTIQQSSMLSALLSIPTIKPSAGTMPDVSSAALATLSPSETESLDSSSHNSSLTSIEVDALKALNGIGGDGLSTSSAEADLPEGVDATDENGDPQSIDESLNEIQEEVNEIADELGNADLSETDKATKKDQLEENLDKANDLEDARERKVQQELDKSLRLQRTGWQAKRFI